MYVESKDTNDDLLWNNFISGNENAYSIIYEKYSKKLINQGLQFTKDRDLIKDCVHDIFVKIYKNRANLKPVNNLKIYLFIALRNNIIREIKKQKTSYELFSDQSGCIQVSDTGTLEDNFIEKETRAINKILIAGILSRLTIRQREVIHYRFFESMSINEIAGLMDMNYQSVQNLIQQALGKISYFWLKNQKNRV
jgi:RNA polymerase sigma factor (sigma-70 family)